jgi:hypothetical protein
MEITVGILGAWSETAPAAARIAELLGIFCQR